MPLEVSPAPFLMQLPYTPKFIPETAAAQPGSLAGAPNGPASAAASVIIPPNPGGVATPHRAIPALAEAGYTSTTMRPAPGSFEQRAMPYQPGFYPSSAGGSLYEESAGRSYLGVPPPNPTKDNGPGHPKRDQDHRHHRQQEEQHRRDRHASHASHKSHHNRRTSERGYYSEGDHDHDHDHEHDHRPHRPHHHRHSSSSHLHHENHEDHRDSRRRAASHSHHHHHHHHHSHHHQHHDDTHTASHRDQSPPPGAGNEYHPHLLRDPYRRRAISMQSDYPPPRLQGGGGPMSALGVPGVGDGTRPYNASLYQTPSVAGGNQGPGVDLYDDGASVAGSGLTFMDGPIGGRTSQYGLPKYAHQMKPDYRRFMVQRGNADVFLD